MRKMILLVLSICPVLLVSAGVIRPDPPGRSSIIDGQNLRLWPLLTTRKPSIFTFPPRITLPPWITPFPWPRPWPWPQPGPWPGPSPCLSCPEPGVLNGRINPVRNPLERGLQLDRIRQNIGVAVPNCGAGEYANPCFGPMCTDEYECTPCPVDYYMPFASKKPCAYCGSTKGTAQPGSTFCMNFCSVGEKLVTETKTKDRLCEPYEVGTYMPEKSLNSSCIPCLNSMATKYNRSKSLANCFLSCPPGQQLNENGTDCVPCPEGTYKGFDVPQQCKVCNNNKTTIVDGAFSWQDCKTFCKPGRLFNNQTGKCDTFCERGTYKDVYSSREECKPCPKNNDSTRGATECFPKYNTNSCI